MGLSFTYLGSAMAFAGRDYGLMIGAIIVTGIEMAAQCGFSHRSTQIIAISLCIGIGATEVPNLFKSMSDLIRDIFAHNSVAGVFVTAMILSLFIPKDNG